MRCPNCLVRVEVHPDIKKGTHVDHTCSCGQALQWDQSIGPVRSGALRLGPPEACKHPERHKPGARVPIP